MENNQTTSYTSNLPLHGDSRNVKPHLPTIYDGPSNSEDSDSESGEVNEKGPELLVAESPPVVLPTSTMTERQGSKSAPVPLMPISEKTEDKTAIPNLCTASTTSLPESSTDQCNNDEQKDSRFSSRTSPTTLSTLTSLSEERKEANSKAENPNAHIDYLRHVHERTRRRKRFRKYLKVLHSFIVCVVPLVSIILGILGILTGHFLHVNSFLAAGCLLLIAACGLILQSCFWTRSMPNKFKPGEIAFNMPQEGSSDVAKYSPQSTEEEICPDQERKSTNDSRPHCTEDNGESGKQSSACPTVTQVLPRCSAQAERVGSTTTPVISNDSISAGVNPAQFRRLSIALNRATEELSAVRRMTQSSGGRMLNLARRLTMGPNFDAFESERDLEAGNGWIGGRVPHGVRRGLAWNATGASRFYASNYD
ncbi:hypothetical protein SprV_0501848700 [Sparganum proliferum]